MSRAERGRSTHLGGFTLLEVLAAVAVLGLVYTVLARSGIMGLQAEGEAERRIEASLLADQVLLGIEEGIEAGAPPKLGEEERDADPFVVTITTTAYDLQLPEVELPKALAEAQQDPRRPGQARRDGPQLGPSFLVGERGQASPLRRVDVVVSWTEGWGERQVTRTTFGLDVVAADASLQAVAAAVRAGAGGAGPGGDGNLGGSGGQQPPATTPVFEAGRRSGPGARR